MIDDVRAYLDQLQNKYGDFDVFGLHGDNKTKWKSWMNAREDVEFLKKVNNRTILPPEVVLDLEEPERYDEVINKLDDDGLFYKAYKTGSKGYHIHLIFPELINYDDYKRKMIKETIIKKYGCDLMKAGNRCGIALEGMPHWKTGNPKTLIKEKEGNNGLILPEEKTELIKPGVGKLVSKFADEVADVIAERKVIFFRKTTFNIVEIKRVGGDKIEKSKRFGQDEFLGFVEVEPNRFITLLERYIIPMVEFFNPKNNKWDRKESSISCQVANVLLSSSNLQDKLYLIDRIFTIPIPIIYDGELTFPKQGYDERFNSWLPYDSPSINPYMDLEEAKIIINDIFKEFCFQDEKSKTNSIAALITPFLRGLYPDFTTRTPIFFYLANRERAGKDYCAGITGIVYEGNAIEEPAISTEDKFSASDELRKKLLSALIYGKKRMHFANNKGHIDNASIEGIATARKYSDRILGRNEVVEFDNEMEFSLSGNMGVTFTPDFGNRCRFINFFLAIEDANKRLFLRPNLHQWVKENREKILSALYSLVRNWYEKGMPKGKSPFASFPEWADICGGIMVNAGLGDPCQSDDENLGIGDPETEEMKLLFELCYQRFPDTWVDKHSIINVITDNQEESLFSSYDFAYNKGDQTKFAKMFEKYVGRIFSDIRLKSTGGKRKSRNKYQFSKIKKEDVTSGNILEDVQKNEKKVTFGNVGNGVIKNNEEIIFDEKNEKIIKKKENDDLVTFGNIDERGNVVTSVTLGNVINPRNLLENRKDCMDIESCQKLPMLPSRGFINENQGKNNIKPFRRVVEDYILSKDEEIEEQSIYDHFKEEVGSEELISGVIAKLKQDGDIFESKKGFIKKLN